jgi:hypothetical protein
MFFQAPEEEHSYKSDKLQKRSTLIKVTKWDESRSRRGVNYFITGEKLEALTIPL